MANPPSPPGLLGDLVASVPGLRVSADDADRVAYGRDMWPRHHLEVRAGASRPGGSGPAAIAWPASTDEVAGVVRHARRAGIALVPFGAGSGVCAGIAPTREALVVDLKRLGRIRRIDAGAPFVEVEAGHMGVPLEKALGREGFTLGHFPSSILCSTVGGWIATRSAGQCSGAYGKIEDMVAGLECVTGDGEVVELRRRTSGVDLVPLVVGSEGTFGIVTSATLRLHPRPEEQAFGAWSFPATRDGWEAMRALFQAGLRPAVARLYDPFDALVAKLGARREGKAHREPSPAPGRGGAMLRGLLARPKRINQLLELRAASWALGGAMLLVVFEGSAGGAAEGLHRARAILEGPTPARWIGEAPARRWLAHRYAVSYRQAPIFSSGAFVDTMEVAAPWSRLEALYDGVRRALGKHVFVMAHLSHAYPDGCCIYFSFLGAAGSGEAARVGWDEACAQTYDRAWRDALQAATEAGGTLAHHHGVGRSKAPELRAEMGAGVDAVRSLMKAFDPGGIMNPGNLAPAATPTPTPTPTTTATTLDRPSLLVHVGGAVELPELERFLRAEGLTLGLPGPVPSSTVADWLARGAPGARDRYLDPADQLLAGLCGTLRDGRVLSVRPAPRRSVGPDLTALFVGAGARFGRVESAWLRVHLAGAPRHESPRFAFDRDPPLSGGERTLVDAIARKLDEDGEDLA